MDAATIEQAKLTVNEGDYFLVRARIERVERWREICNEMPHLAFPRGWEVAIIPPFGGAVARFRVRKGRAAVSVYADYYERLGGWSEPHWEIYPGPSGENEWFSIATETDEMLAAIAKSLRAQAIEARRAETPKSGSVEDESAVPEGNAP